MARRSQAKNWCSFSLNYGLVILSEDEAYLSVYHMVLFNGKYQQNLSTPTNLPFLQWFLPQQMAFSILTIKFMSSDSISKATNSCWVAISGVSWVKSERLKNEANHFRLVGDSFNKQGNFHLRLVLDCCKMSRYLHLPTRIMKVYRRALTGLRHVFSPVDSVSSYSLKDASLKWQLVWIE